MTYTVYEQSSGLITGRVSCRKSDILSNVPDGYSYIEGDNDDAGFFINNREAVPRQAMTISTNKHKIIPDGSDKATLSACPEGAEVWRESEYLGLVPADGLIEVTSLIAKKIKIKVVLFPWLDWEVTINAT
jgi:hypothetical protein